MKNKILWVITYVMAFILILSISLIDSDSYIPLIGMVISGVWLIIFTQVNKEKLEKIFFD